MKDFDEKAIIERLKLLREQYAGSRGKSKFARDLGISPSTYSYYENDRLPPIETLHNICELTGTTLDWLINGRKEGKPSQKPAYPELTEKINEFVNQNPEQLRALLTFIEVWGQKKTIEAEAAPMQSRPAAKRPGWIPVLGRTAAGMVHFWEQTNLPEPAKAVTQLDELVEKHTGRAMIESGNAAVSIDLSAKPLLAGLSNPTASLVQIAGATEESVTQFVNCRQIRKLFPDCFALQIDGDSMAPRISDGDIVVVSPSVPAGQINIAVARIDGQIGVTCKLIRIDGEKVHLIPINERYETKIVEKNRLIWALAVLCRIRAV